MLYLRAPWAVVGLWTVATLADAAIAYATLRLNVTESSGTAELKSLKDEVSTLETQMAGIISGTNGLNMQGAGRYG